MLLVKYFAMCVENALVGSVGVDPRRDAEALAADRPAIADVERDVDVGDRVGVVRRRGGEELERGLEVGVRRGREPGAEVRGFHDARARLRSPRGNRPGCSARPRRRHRDVPVATAGGGVPAHHADHRAARRRWAARAASMVASCSARAIAKSTPCPGPWNQSPMTSSTVDPAPPPRRTVVGRRCGRSARPACTGAHAAGRTGAFRAGRGRSQRRGPYSSFARVARRAPDRSGGSPRRNIQETVAGMVPG